ncbi:MAG: hypothetical protein ACREVL_16925, partial [Solimonas sp.]
TQASTLAQNIIDRMRANRQAVLANNYDLEAGDAPPGPAKNCGDENCSFSELAAWDLALWYRSIAPDADYAADTVPASLESALPGGRASIACLDATCTVDSPRLVTLYWDTNRSGATGYGCDPDTATDLACFRLIYTP